jgi:hypothetical protein
MPVYAGAHQIDFIELKQKVEVYWTNQKLSRGLGKERSIFES